MPYTRALLFMKLFMLFCGSSWIIPKTKVFPKSQLNTLPMHFSFYHYQKLIGEIF